MTPADIIKLAHEHGLAIDMTTPVNEGLDIVFKLGRIIENKECERLCAQAAAESAKTFEACRDQKEVSAGLVAAGARAQAEKLQQSIRMRYPS